ncbi:esterase/lipase family protein [Ideonella sp.]|uniref:esterase/lipase family protein n=1 Tax=Ideonella sp. TaxID=1929293 RepID=UPI0035B472A2
MIPPVIDPAAALFDAATRSLEDDGLEVGNKAGPALRVAEARRRRMAAAPTAGRAAYLTLVRGSDGLLDFQCDAGPAMRPRQRAWRRGAPGIFDAVPINHTLFRPVEGSKVSEFLEKLDNGFNPRYGLFDLHGQRVNQVAPAGKVLLIVHGTFSKGDAILGQLREAKNAAGQSVGRQLLQAAGTAYQQVLVFEHPTLQVGPWVNALDLARAFAGSRAQVDVVCHSRGGLVTRWWLEVLQPQMLASARVVFVASPLMGTGLASPYRLRTALKLLANYSAAVGGAAGLAGLALPMFKVVEGLATLLASGSALLGSSPVADAAVAMVPGLASMSRYGPDGVDFIKGNVELEKLSFGWTAPPPGYFAVTSNFESAAVGWRFWEAFRRPAQRLADAGTDLLFSGANDFVVDTESMARVGVGADIVDPRNRFDFGTNDRVHHVNYFLQPETIDFIRQSLAF